MKPTPKPNEGANCDEANTEVGRKETYQPLSERVQAQLENVPYIEPGDYQAELLAIDGLLPRKAGDLRSVYARFLEALGAKGPQSIVMAAQPGTQTVGERPCWIIVAEGEGAQAKAIYDALPHQAVHDFMCVCGLDWRKCATENITADVSQIDDVDSWAFNDSGEKFSVCWPHEIGKVTLYVASVAAQPAGECYRHRELLAQWMFEHSLATGHGNTFDDLLKEMSWQIEELRRRAAQPADGAREQAIEECASLAEVINLPDCEQRCGEYIADRLRALAAQTASDSSLPAFIPPRRTEEHG